MANIKRKEFLKILSQWKKAYIRKPRSWQKIWLWWEKLDSHPDEQWFMNISKTSRNGKEPPVWVIATDLNHWLDAYERDGYKYYYDE